MIAKAPKGVLTLQRFVVDSRPEERWFLESTLQMVEANHRLAKLFTQG
jgi:hypothetical protein